MFQQKLNYESGEPCYWLNLGDWVPPYGMPSDEIVHTFYLWLCANNTANAAKVLGDEAGYKEFHNIAQRTWEAFHRKFYDAEKCSYGDFGPNILALYMGVPEGRKDAVIKTLRHEIMDVHGGHINTGFVTTKFFFETLTDNGLHDVATTTILKTDYPSYGHWIEQGATVTWEQWDGKNSHNHPMFGGGLTWLARRLAGVNVTTEGAGYRHFEVRPVPAVGVDTVFYSQHTPQGLLSSRVISHDGKLRSVEVRVPVGSTATVFLPDDTIRVQQGSYVLSPH
jgi:alpha-L-rhamnosidase